MQVLKEKESNYISEIKGIKSQNELMKKELEVLKKEVESYKSKLESRISENNGLKDEIKTLKLGWIISEQAASQASAAAGPPWLQAAKTPKAFSGASQTTA